MIFLFTFATLAAGRGADDHDDQAVGVDSRVHRCRGAAGNAVSLQRFQWQNNCFGEDSACHQPRPSRLIFAPRSVVIVLLCWCDRSRRSSRRTTLRRQTPARCCTSASTPATTTPCPGCVANTFMCFRSRNTQNPTTFGLECSARCCTSTSNPATTTPCPGCAQGPNTCINTFAPPVGLRSSLESEGGCTASKQ